MPRVGTAAAGAIVAALLACGAGTTNPREPRRNLPAYDGHSAELFDDAFDPAALGLELVQAPPPANNALLRERTQVGDAVVRAQLTTVTSKDMDNGRSWQMGFHTIETLSVLRPLETEFTVQVAPNGLSAGGLRVFEGRLVGKTFVAFVREFAERDGSGDANLHFHLAPDAKAYVAAVRAAIAREQVR